MAAASVAGAGIDFDFDFEDQSPGLASGETLTLNSQGVDATFTAPELQIRFLSGSFDTQVLSSRADAGPIEVSFSTPVQEVSFENVINGRFSSEVDFIAGTAFDIDDNIIDSFALTDESFPTLSGAGIARVVWEGAGDGTGFVIDNVSFVIPSPGAASLLAFGLVAASRRRRA